MFFVEQDVYVYEELTKDDYEQIKIKYINLINTIDNETEYKCKKTEDCINCDYYNHCKPFNIKLTKGN